MVWAAYSNPQIAHRTPARRSGLSGSRWEVAVQRMRVSSQDSTVSKRHMAPA